MRELQRAKDVAEQANRVKDVFLANISHELRTPLNGVLSMMQLVDSLPLGDRQRNYLHTAQESGQTLLRIISDLLDFSCMESGKMSLNLQPFEGKKSVDSALDMFRAEAKKKGLTLSSALDPNIPRVLLGDEARLRQLIFNLVGNSLKFTPSGGIRVTCTRIPHAPAGKSGVQLEVKDTGIGIAKSNLTGIFEAFNQMGSIHRKNYSGTGLGLGIVKHLTRLMGGEVRIESEENVGTTVRCSLFFDNLSEKQPDDAVEETAPDTLCVRPLDILVAEYDAVGSLAMRLFLEKRGHKVVCVDDGYQAIEAMRAYPFDCIFTDITMPLLSGMELARNIRAGGMLDIHPSDEVRRKIGRVFPGKENADYPLNAEAPIVAVSAHTMLSDRERFLQAGMDYYISKPIIKEELDAALRAVCAKLAARPDEAAQPSE
jgi:CheY-like chemotaxis protein